METKDIVILAVTLLILGEVTYLLARMPKTSLKAKDRAILVDTSVLMDGRIASVAATGFIGGTLVIPRSVVGELQFLADNADAEKRARARYGLDIVRELQDMDNVEVELLQDGSKAAEGVDERLLTLAKRHHAVICTLDFNLNKVAVVEGITVLNLNELAQSIRMSHLPGDQMAVALVQKGQDAHQAVGYMPDGTMVVVEQSSSMIGQTVLVEIVRSIQTAAGKMMFAKRVDVKSPEKDKKQAPVAQSVQKAKTNGRKVVAHLKPQSRPASPKKASQSSSSQQSSQRPPKRPAQTPTQKPAIDSRPTPARRPRRRQGDAESALIALVDDQK